MPLGRFFGRGNARSDAPAADTTPDETIDVEVDAESEGELIDYEGAPEDAPDIDWRARAAAIIPGGASTGSKRPATMHGAPDAHLPTLYLRAAGCRVMALDGREYLDCTMALGAVALGYAEPEVTRAVVDAAFAGNVAMLPNVLEVEIAERLCDVIPCAEMALFTKTGAEGLSAAVRLARTATGRDVVVASGYFGWHDWASEKTAGVPASATQDVVRVPFNDVAALERAVSDAGARLAAIVIEPVVERMPDESWIQRARALADQQGAALVFDEVKTGFRLRPGGYQELSGVTPDLAVFAKAMANGYPLAAVVGRKDLMEASERTWISSTLAGDTTALAAAGAVLDWHEKVDVCGGLAEVGAEMRRVVGAAVEASGVQGMSVEGIDPMWFVRFDDPSRETRFLELIGSEGVLLKRGAYNFPSLAHDDEAILELERAASAACVALRDEESGR